MNLSHKHTPAAQTTIRRIAQRTRGRKHGPATRLMSPSDFGELLKPFVFLDLFEYEGPPFEAGASSPFRHRHVELRNGRLG